MAASALLGVSAHAQTANLSASINAPAAVNNSTEIDIDVVLNNGGTSPAPGATYIINFGATASPGVQIVSATCVAGGVNCPSMVVAAPQVTGTFTTFNASAPGNDQSATVRVRVRTPVAAGPGAVQVAASVAVPAGTIDPVPGNNSSSTNIPISYRPIDLVATPSGSNPASYTLGSPYSYSVTYTNLASAGSGPADGSRITGTWTSTFLGGATALSYSNLQVGCTAAGGAVCPIITQPAASGSFVKPGNGNAFALEVYDTNVPVWPVGGSVTFTYTADLASTYTMACNPPGDRIVNFSHSSSAQATPGLADSDAANNAASTGSNGPAVPDCTKLDVEVVSRVITPIPGGDYLVDPLVFNTQASVTLVFRNNGPGAADGSRIEGWVASDDPNLPRAIHGFLFDTGSVTCVATPGTTCPVLNSPLVSGHMKRPPQAMFAPATVATWPAGGEITVTYRFTPREYVRIATCAPLAPYA